MKHLLILLSLLLLSSFLISCEKKEETLYMWETGQNRSVIDETAENGVKFIPIVEWKEIGDKDTQIQYKGFVDDGFPEGKGVMTFPDGQKYVGEFKDGIFHGQGTYTFPNGKKYVGKFKDNEYNGHGTLTFLNGNKYVGEFKDGKMNGQGTYTYQNGKYVGEWKDGKMNGQGTYTWGPQVMQLENVDNRNFPVLVQMGGATFVGEWKDDKQWNGISKLKEGDIKDHKGKIITGKDIRLSDLDSKKITTRIFAKWVNGKKQ